MIGIFSLLAIIGAFADGVGRGLLALILVPLFAVIARSRPDLAA